MTASQERKMAVRRKNARTKPRSNARKEIIKAKGILDKLDGDQALCMAIVKHTHGWIERGAKIGVVKLSGCRKVVTVNELLDEGAIKYGKAKELEKMVCQLSLGLAEQPALASMFKKGFKVMKIEFVVSPGNQVHKKAVHRDHDSEEEAVEGCVVVSVALNDFSLSNGSVRFWVDSTLFPHDPRSPNRRTEESRVFDLTAKTGDIWAWDCRMLHQSMPNTTSETTAKLTWYMITPDYLRQFPHYKIGEVKVNLPKRKLSGKTTHPNSKHGK